MKIPWPCPLSDANTTSPGLSEPKLWAFLKAYLAGAPGKMSQIKDYWMPIFLIKIDDLFQEFGPEFGHVSEQ